MLMQKASASRHSCPVRPATSCMGAMCPAWREASEDAGWCGVGGPPSTFSLKAAEPAPVAPYQVQPAPAKVTRPVRAGRRGR